MTSRISDTVLDARRIALRPKLDDFFSAVFKILIIVQTDSDHDEDDIL